jgi:phosphatidylinositol-3-phosphatase
MRTRPPHGPTPWVLAALALGIAPGTASAATLRPSADFSVGAARPRANFGAAKRLVAARAPAQRAFVRFELDGPLARGTRVTLRLYPLIDAPAGIALRHASDRAWAERTETFRTAPHTGPRVVLSGPLVRHRWKSIDVGYLVGQSTRRVSLALSTTGAAPVAIASRETGATAPKLDLEPPAGHTRPTSPASAPPPPPVRPIPPGGAPSLPRPSSSTPCGVTGPPAAWQHVVWIVMENKGFGRIVGSPDAPFVSALAARCGLATSFFALAHPSLPNYIAMTSGDTQGVTGDVAPAAQPLAAPSIFSQLGDGWRALAESMPANCAGVGTGEYTPTHNPALYYTDVAAACAQQSTPLGSPPDLSARFTFITPDKCSATHDCPVAAGDLWLSQIVPQLLDSPQYQSGTTAIFLTWDEADGGVDQRIATLVIAPGTPAGAQDASMYTHYSLLRTTEEMLGLPLLANAANAASMRAGFGL